MAEMCILIAKCEKWAFSNVNNDWCFFGTNCHENINLG